MENSGIEVNFTKRPPVLDARVDIVRAKTTLDSARREAHNLFWTVCRCLLTRLVYHDKIWSNV